MNKLTVLLIVMFVATCGFAQNISVKSFRQLTNDMDARTLAPKKDQNGQQCAIVKIVTTEKGFAFDAGSIGIVATEQKVGEIWLWIPPGSKRLTIKHDKLGVLRDYFYTESILEGTVYELVLMTGKVTTIVEETPTMQWVVVNSFPSNAEVYIDDKNVGKTPFQREFNEGRHTYRIEKDLYHTEAGAFELSANGQRQEMNFQLKHNFGFVEINTTPEDGANVTIDGVSQNQITPFKSDSLKSGNHNLILEKTMYKTANQDFVIKDDQTTKLNISLIPTFGTLTINSTPESGAAITLDGQPTYKLTSFCFEKLAAGSHTITVRKDGYETKTEKFTIVSGTKETKTITMQPTFGEVEIRTSPIADIYIDNQKVGLDTLKIRLNEGTHTFEARKDKHHSDIQKFDIAIGDKKQINLAPKPMNGKLKIVSNPFNAEITLNDKKYGTTPVTINNLLIGEYKLKLSKDGFVDISKTLQIKENELVSEEFTLTSKLDVVITSNVDGSNVYIDNQFIGKAPLNTKLELGEHTVKVENGTEYETINKNITVIQNETTFYFELQLSRAREHERNNFVNSLYKVEKDNYLFFETLFTYSFQNQVIVSYIDSRPALTIPLMFNVTYFSRDLSVYNSSFYWRLNICSGDFITKQFFSLDFFSAGAGFIFADHWHKNRLLIDLKGGAIISYPLVIGEYKLSGRTIIQSSGPSTDKDGKKSYGSSYGAIPANLKVSYEHNFAKTYFLVIQAGLCYGIKTDWYYKDELDNWKNNGGTSPSSISNSNLPKSPFIEGFKPYLGVGIRF